MSDLDSALDMIEGYKEHGLICREALEVEMLRMGYTKEIIEKALKLTKGLCSVDIEY
jgi:hypothetical protein